MSRDIPLIDLTLLPDTEGDGLLASEKDRVVSSGGESFLEDGTIAPPPTARDPLSDCTTDSGSDEDPSGKPVHAEKDVGKEVHTEVLTRQGNDIETTVHPKSIDMPIHPENDAEVPICSGSDVKISTRLENDANIAVLPENDANIAVRPENDAEKSVHSESDAEFLVHPESHTRIQIRPENDAKMPLHTENDGLKDLPLT